jgi:hypothetical protein
VSRRSCRRNQETRPSSEPEQTDLTETDNTDRTRRESADTPNIQPPDESVAETKQKDSDIYKKMSIHELKLMAMSMGLSQDTTKLKKAGNY